LLDDRDRAGVRAALEADPVAACMVAARVEVAGLDPWRLGGELWSVGPRLDGLCFSGANLVPLRGERSALRMATTVKAPAAAQSTEKARRMSTPVRRANGRERKPGLRVPLLSR